MGIKSLFLTIVASFVILALNYAGWFAQIKGALRSFFVVLFMIYPVPPLVFHFAPWIQRALVFLPWVNFPTHVNFSDPESEGLLGVRNFSLEIQGGGTIGVWHILPKSLAPGASDRGEPFWESSLASSGRPIILYLHGNTGSRALPHRKELYLILQNLDYHILCLDYRGFADSSKEAPPSESGLVADALRLYNYARDVVGNSDKSPNIIVWGHSLGTGVASHLVANLCQAGLDDRPSALILESPFTTIADEVKHHIGTAAYKYLRTFHTIFADPLIRNDMGFESERHIAFVDVPLAILHAKDDPVIPYELGKRLYSMARAQKLPDARRVHFRRFDEGYGYGHKFICRAPELAGLIDNFVTSAHASADEDGDAWPCPNFTNEEAEDEF